MDIRESLNILALMESATSIPDQFVAAAYYAAFDADPDIAFSASLLLIAGQAAGFAPLPNMVEISDIGVGDKEQGKGVGTKLMNLLCDLADRMGVTLVLSTWDSPEMDLDAWYSRFGFEGFRTMFRLPADHRRSA